MEQSRRRFVVGMAGLVALLPFRQKPNSGGDWGSGTDRAIKDRCLAVAFTLPFVEAVLALLLASGVRPLAVAGVTSGLFLVFAGGLSLSLVRGATGSCGCFGGDGRANWSLVMRNIGMAALVLSTLSTGGALVFGLIGAGLISSSVIKLPAIPRLNLKSS